MERLVELPVGNPKLSLLVADDNIDAADMLQFFLGPMGCEVRLAHTASAALEAIAFAMPDVCILGIGLPDSL
ncbi:hypothetical protein ACHAC9_03840 [Massilia sp. CMS3.1]|uniref:hypothetical protein n=1 Tax=Massilia sp. CMS3.1 TaxID=3373083 RepID=UPI003EE48A94